MTAVGCEEQVVLLDEEGNRIGVEAKATVHRSRTPLHLAFSCYAFTTGGEVLVTRRALHKATFPGVWTNTCCGHPAPAESFETAIRRRATDELGIALDHIRVALPNFRYRAEMNGIEENEICPVYLARFETSADPNPDEVCEVSTMTWPEFAEHALNDPAFSPWAKLQVAQLVETDHVEAYLAQTTTNNPAGA